MLTVVTPAATIDLTTLATAKAEMSISGHDQDGQLCRWIREASGIIAAHCRRVFGQETVTETFRPRSCIESLILSRYPITAVDSITENSAALASEDYEVDASGGMLTRLRGTALVDWPPGTIVVQYRAGYDLISGLPFPLERACLQMVKTLRAGSTRDPLVKAVDIPGVLRTDYWVGGFGGSNLPPDVQSLLAPFRDMRVR